MEKLAKSYPRNNAVLLPSSVLGGLLIALLAATLGPGAVAQTATVGTADSTRYLDTIKALTAPAMEGRGDDTQGIGRAADLIEQRYRSLGLEAAGTNGYFQPFSVVTGAKLAGKNQIEQQIGNQRKQLRLSDDFVPFSFSSSGQVTAPVVFAGYGASAEEFDYDDYKGISVAGKIVVLLRYEPGSFAAKSGNQGFTRHAALLTKAINARNHGAAAVVVVNGKLASGENDLLTRFGSVSGPENVGLILVQVKNDVAQEWLAAAGKSLTDLENQMDSSTRAHSFGFPANVRLTINVHIETTRATVNNVLAYLPGKSDEYVILGAHYDHLGYGHYDSLAPAQIGQIHPGADDNASGTAGVLELARMLAGLKGQLPRGVLFASFAGEELGLLGSADWVKEPTRPIAKAVAMLNMDMIGRIRGEKVYIGGVGTGSTFETELSRAEQGFPFRIENSPGGYASSDHTSFVAKKIPVLFFFSGLHSDYHRPSDTWDKINAPDAARLVDMIAKVTLEIDEGKERPAFVTVVEHENPHAGVAGAGGYGPYFGSIPDFGQSENGVRFSDVQPNSPAAKAGLKGGDVLVKFGERKILNLYDFTDALRSSKIGDVVQVTVTRDGKQLTVPVTLEQRR
jgi:peptidase M28-like protein/PDZ domain-containing protein/PA domain-containing protein